MKKFAYLITLLLGFWQLNAQTYCTPSFQFGCVGGDNINSFEIPSASFSHTNTGCSDNAYGDYTSMQINVQAAVTYGYKVTHNYDESEHVKIWVDFNNDGVFDDAAPELLSSAVEGVNFTTTGTITIPSTVAPGNYRLRIAALYYSDPIPCNVGGSGEAHDYTLVVAAAPSCFAPIQVTAGSVTHTSAIISWTAPTLAPSLGYDLYYSTSNTVPSSTTTPSQTNISGTSTTISGLTPATPYYVWVRSNCSATDQSAWSSPDLSFITVCYADNVPYLLDFESTTNTGLPICTSNQNVGSGNNWYVDDSPGYGFTSRILTYKLNVDNAANTWFFTNGINLTAGTSYRIKFKYGNDTTATEKMKVSYGTGADAASMTNLIHDYTAITGGVLTQDFYDFIPSTTGVYYFGFNAYSDANLYRIFVDDINIILTPACSEPTALTSTNITSNAATVSWTGPATAPVNGYEYVYSTTNTAPTGSGTATTSTSVNLTGLTPNTTYYYWVRSMCAGSESIWSAGTFTTLNAPPANDDCSNAVSLTPGATFASNPLIGNTVGATAGTGSPTGPSCGAQDSNGGLTTINVWYKVVVPASGNITIETALGNAAPYLADTVLTAYTGDCTTLTEVGCNDEYSSDPDYHFSKLSLTGQTPGATLYVSVWRFGNEFGNEDDGQFKISAYDSSLGTNELSLTKNTVTIYPNPFKDILNISDVKGVKSVTITDASGRTVKTIAKPSSVLNLSDLNSGLYMLKLHYDNGSVKTMKAIKK